MTSKPKAPAPAAPVAAAVAEAFAALTPAPEQPAAPAEPDAVLDLEMALTRMSGAGYPSIGLAAFDQREQRSGRVRDTEAAYAARYAAMMAEPA